MATRYERPEEWLPDLAKSMRRGVRDVQRPTGTERALTAETAERAEENAGEAVLAADAAAAAALLAKTTADGRNRVFAAGVKPVAPADAPFVAGDLWYETDMLGRFVNVSVWSAVANDFVEHQMVASSVLVPGSVGNVLIANGAIDGKTITGATIRTAASGQRMQFDVEGLASYDAGGTQTAILSAAGSGMAMRDAGSNLVSLSPRFGLVGSVASDADRLGTWTLNTNGLALRKGAPEQVLQLEFLGPSLSPTSCRIFTSVPFAIQAPGDMSIATVGTAVGKRITIEHEFAKLSKVEMSSSEVLLNSISRGRLSFGDQATAQGGYIEGIGTGGGYKGGLLLQGGSNGTTTENGIVITAGAGGDVTLKAATGQKIRMLSDVEYADDLAWVDLAPASGWTTAATDGYPKLSVRRRNGMVELRGIANRASWTANTLVATLPVGYRPAHNTDGVFRHTSVNVGAVQIFANGQINAFAAGSAFAVFSGVWMLG